MSDDKYPCCEDCEFYCQDTSPEPPFCGLQGRGRPLSVCGSFAAKLDHSEAVEKARQS